MHDVITNLDQEVLLGFGGMILGAIALLGGTIVATTAVLSAHYRRAQRDEMEATLKMEMIQRGMPAAEIVQVLAARMGPPKPDVREWMGRAQRAQAQMAKAFAKPCEKT